ncbi:MAG: hypothetical protein WC058_01640, partial [Phycisphaeraceae bacterium]
KTAFLTQKRGLQEPKSTFFVSFHWLTLIIGSKTAILRERLPLANPFDHVGTGHAILDRQTTAIRPTNCSGCFVAAPYWRVAAVVSCLPGPEHGVALRGGRGISDF